MLVAIVAVIVGLVVLAWSADKFVGAAGAVSALLGMPPLLIGIVILGFGTSAPELVVSVFAAADGHPEIALGNALGSNIANIGLILGITVLIMPVVVKSKVLKREFPFLIAATALTWLLLADRDLSRLDAGILVLALVGFLLWSVLLSRREHDPEFEREVAEELSSDSPVWKSWLWLLVGLVLLVISSRLLVFGAETIARELGWSDLIIGLTVVAIGTSAPELAASIAAARQGRPDMVVGNIIGSNLFNTLGVIGLAGLISPLVVDPAIVTRDMPVTMAFTLVLLLFAVLGGTKRGIGRWQGGVLLTGWVSYTAFLFFTLS